jgi:hypothetical protein
LLTSKLLDDAELHDHPIGDRPIPWWAIGMPKYDDMGIEHRWIINSPFATDIDNYRAVTLYKTYKGDMQKETTLSWLGMLLLPLGITIRTFKTSIELFVLPK